MLLEYAATLGMIDVALIPPAGARRDFRNMWGTDELAFFSRYDGLMYFRLTPLGAYCLGVESDYQPDVSLWRNSRLYGCWRFLEGGRPVRNSN